MALDDWMYRDPFDVAARREALEQRQTTACGACIHRRSMDWKGETWNFCANKRRVYGVRCELYETKEAK